MSHLLPAALPVLDGLGEVDLGGEQVGLARHGRDRARRRGVENQCLHAAPFCRVVVAAALSSAAAEGAVDVGSHDRDEVERGREALGASLVAAARGHKRASFYFLFSQARRAKNEEEEDEEVT